MQPRNPFFHGGLDQFIQEMLRRPSLPPARLAADIYETIDGNAFVVEIAVPGAKPDEITVEATSGSLIVYTEPQDAEPEHNRNYIHREHRAGPMARLIEFPGEIDTDRIQATLEHGILRIQVPKAFASKSKVIKITPST